MSAELDYGWGFELDVRPLNPRVMGLYPELKSENEVEEEDTPLLGLSGFLLRWTGLEPLVISGGKVSSNGDDLTRIGTGIALHMTSPNMVGCIMPLSDPSDTESIGEGIITDVVDQSNTEELTVAVGRITEAGDRTILPGDPIARLVLMPTMPFKIRKVEMSDG